MATIPDKYDAASKNFTEWANKTLPKALPEGVEIQEKARPGWAQDGDLDFVFKATNRAKRDWIKKNHPNPSLKPTNTIGEQEVLTDILPFENNGGTQFEPSIGRVKSYIENNYSPETVKEDVKNKAEETADSEAVQIMDKLRSPIIIAVSAVSIATLIYNYSEGGGS